MEVKRRQVERYKDAKGRSLIDEWTSRLSDRQARTRIRIRLLRLAAGNPGDSKALGGALYELRLHFGPGYRVYYGEDGPTLVLLLCGGDKASQKTDLSMARLCWSDYLERKQR
jgi:putative addiction module killer protein